VVAGGTRRFDDLVLGAGWGGLAAASLLARQGHKVAVLEARDRAGGCGQTLGFDGFSFCAEMQYLMGCGPGGVVRRWLEVMGLEDEIQFNAFDPDGYDRIELPDFEFRIPNDPHRLQAALRQAFPEEASKIDELFAVFFSIQEETRGRAFDAMTFLHNPFQFKNTVLYGPWSAGRVFDHFELSPRLQAVLAGQCGDIGLPPREEPLFCLLAVLFGYCESAHFPKLGMGHFVERVMRYIVDHGGEFHFETRVSGIASEGDRITAVETSRGRFSAERIISNIDPAVTMEMIEGADVPEYEQTPSCFTIFLGLDIDLGERGFDRSNRWNFPEVDLDAAIDRSLVQHDYSDPFYFLSTPSLVADPGVLAPVGSTTVQINVASDYDFFDAAAGRGEHASEKARVAREILAAVQRRSIPGLHDHIVVEECWSPVDLARHTGLARGGMYGARLDFLNRVVRRVSQRTKFENLFLTGATAGGPGLQGVVGASMRLVERMLNESVAPSR
jgi:all-trans-retinol 13,14-reductase